MAMIWSNNSEQRPECAIVSRRTTTAEKFIKEERSLTPLQVLFNALCNPHGHLFPYPANKVGPIITKLLTCLPWKAATLIPHASFLWGSTSDEQVSRPGSTPAKHPNATLGRREDWPQGIYIVVHVRRPSGMCTLPRNLITELEELRGFSLDKISGHDRSAVNARSDLSLLAMSLYRSRP